jgi:opacity protein-like surface antigen
MSSVKVCFVVALSGAAFLANQAQAADVPSNPPAIVQQPVPVIEEIAQGWYLRGDVGGGMMRSDRLSVTPLPATGVIENTALGDAWFVGLGVGYQYDWLRFDVTGEYRGKASFNAISSYTAGCATGTCLDVYNGFLKSWLVLVNVYADLGTWWCFTPFVGVGVGGAYNTITGFSDFGPQTAGRGFAQDHSQWTLAWALHAGLAYNVSKNFKNIHSHDFKIGLRWLCCEDTPQPRYIYPEPAYVPPPPPVYSPPPPLMRRG